MVNENEDWIATGNGDYWTNEELLKFLSKSQIKKLLRSSVEDRSKLMNKWEKEAETEEVYDG